MLTAYKNHGIAVPGLYEQVLSSHGLPRLAHTSIQTNTREEREFHLSNIMARESALPFDYESVPLLRARLLNFGRDDHALILAVPHVATDTASFDIVWEDICQLYRQALEGPESEASPVRQFHDFARWQSEQLFAETFSDSRDYWTDQWARYQSARLGVSDILRSKAYCATTSPGAAIRLLGGDVSERVVEQSRVLGVAPFVTLLSALYVLLHRLTQRHEIALWTPFANRLNETDERLVGRVANRHMVGITVDPSWSFAEIVEACRLTLVNAQRHQAVPLAHLALRSSGAVGGKAGARILFDWQTSDEHYVHDGLVADRPLLNWRRAVLAAGLTIRVVSRGSEFALVALYSRSACPDRSAQALLREYAAVVGQFALDASLPIGPRSTAQIVVPG